MNLNPAGALLVLTCLAQCDVGAQQRLGNTMQQLPPFADSVLHQGMQDILVAMDAFHAERSMDLIGKAMQRAEADGDPEVLHYLLGYRAEVLYYEGLFNDAMRDLDRCEELAVELGDSTLIANVYNLKGLLHENIQDSRLALPYLRLALDWFPNKPAARYPVSELHHIHGNLGSHLTTLDRLDSASLHLKLSLHYARIANAPRAIAVAHWSSGNLYLKRQQADSALWHFDQAVRVANDARDRDIGVDALVGRCLALVALGRPDEARHALDSTALYLARHREGIGLVTQRNYARTASAAANALGDLPRALLLLAQWHRIDSTITAHNIHTALATQAELLETDKTLAVERLETLRYAETLAYERSTRTIIIAAAALLLVVLCLLYVVNIKRLRQKERLAHLQLLRVEHERTIDELRIRDQVGRDMHDDLGAGLSALKLHTELVARSEKDPNKRVQFNAMARQSGELIASMRHIIWALNAGKSSLEDLAAYVTGYTRKLLDEQGLAAEVHCDGPWPPMVLGAQQRRNLFLVVKEALNNVVKHAQATRVELRMSWDNGLHMVIRDNGLGIPGGASENGNGLRNMRLRVAEMGGEIAFHSGPGTVVEVHIPAEGLNKSYVDGTPPLTDLRPS